MMFYQSTDWKFFNRTIIPDINSIHVFRIPIDEEYQHIKDIYTHVLSEKELAEIDRYLNPHSKIIHIVSKYYTRKILSDFISIAPNKIKFYQSENKKPAVDGLEFNVSHSGNLLLIAVSNYPIGIDIELINKDFDFEYILKNCFSEKEIAYINNCSDHFLGFYTLWTRKEALLKATGEGLIDNLNELDCLSNAIVRRNIEYTFKSIITDNNYLATLVFNKNRIITVIIGTIN